VAGNIQKSGQVDLLTFSGTMGATVDLTLVDTAGFRAFVEAAATVFAPSGADVVAFNANTLKSLTLPESGTFVFPMTFSALVSGGTYNVGLSCLP